MLRHFFSYYFLIHCRGVRLVGVLVYLGYFNLKRALAEGDLNNIANLNLIAGLDLTAVDAYALSVAGLVCHSAALYKAGNLQILVNSHLILLFQHKSGTAEIGPCRFYARGN